MSAAAVFVGASGAGKTTIGALLAGRLRLAHVDVDAEIERRTGKLIREIFADSGEAFFRDLEREVAVEALARPAVVSLGGGAPLDPDIRAALAGLPVVWLQVPVGEAVKRIGLDENRPLLHGAGMRGALIRMLAQRTPVYEAVSTIVVDTAGRGPREVADDVTARLNAARQAG